MAELPGSTLVAKCVVQLFLLRRATTHLFRDFVPQLPGTTSLTIDNRREDVSEVWPLMDRSIGWQEHSASSWILSGSPFDSPPLNLAHFGTNHDRAVYLLAIAESCPWALLPFGADYTGLMVCFVSKNPEIHERIWQSEQRSTLGQYFVSAYSRGDLEQQRFRGVIFSRVADLRGSLIWHYSGDSSAYLLRADSLDSPLRLTVGADVVMTAKTETLSQTAQLRWIRASNEDAFVRVARDPQTRLVVGARATEAFLLSAFNQFSDVNRDPLWFGLKALSDASWLYIPSTEQLQREIYLNVDPMVTSALITSDRMTKVEYFNENGFC